MKHSTTQVNQLSGRRQRLHEILVALIQQQENLELMDADGPGFDQSNLASKDVDPAKWLNHNQRILKSYQSLVRSAIALDALLESEQCEL